MAPPAAGLSEPERGADGAQAAAAGAAAGTPASSLERAGPARARTTRAAALVALVWAVAALPFVIGAVRCPTAELLHYPCPGCGMTRAFHLLADGRVADSLAMHPLAVPTAFVQVALALATVAATLRLGAPWALVRTSWGRVATGAVVLVIAADVVLWIARAFGALGGPVPV